MWIEVREKQAKEDFTRGTIVSHLADNFGSGLSNFFPAFLREEHDHGDDSPTQFRPNLSRSVAQYLGMFGLNVADLFFHIAAVLHSPKYRRKNAGGLRMDWPRIPLPQDKEILMASSELGQRMAALLDPEKPVPDVTAGGLRAEIKLLGLPSKVGGEDFDADDFAMTAGWGATQVTKNGAIVMPGQGKSIERDYQPEEVQALAAGSGPLGLTISSVMELLGTKAYDVYLNADAYWSNVPARVWEYKLGGYPVIKKWLSYRGRDILGRPLRLEEVWEVTNMIRRIAAILLLTPDLDANYEAVRNETVNPRAAASMAEPFNAGP